MNSLTTVVVFSLAIALVFPFQVIAQNLAGSFDVILQPGVLHGYILGDCSETRAYIPEITPLVQQEVVIERCTIGPEYDGAVWRDVLRVQLRAVDPVTSVNIRIYDSSGMPIHSQQTTTLQPGVLHGFLLGSSANGGTYIPELTPVSLADAIVDKCYVQPEFNGSSWNDVLRIQTTSSSPPLSVQVRTYQASQVPSYEPFNITLQPGDLQGFVLGPSAARRSYVPDVSPQTALSAVFEKIVVQPEYNASTATWSDVLRVQTSAASPVIQATVQVHKVVDPPIFDPMHETVPPFLSTPVDECSRVVPVLVIMYLPTQNGIDLDVSIDPDYWSLNPITIVQLKSNIMTYMQRLKFALEQGSRFRAYGNPSAKPYIGYQIVDIISVYETTPPGYVTGHSGGFPVYDRDYHEIFDRFNVSDYLNQQGVSEIWFWGGGFDSSYPSYNPEIHSPVDFRLFWESNMRSPVTTDISNSTRVNGDLPPYDHTYVVYSYNFRRSHAEAIHNHGHQIEQMLDYVNGQQDGDNLLFWHQFVGQDNSGDFITGRCGWTHMPPNTIGNYDYLNPTLVESDIADWTPFGTGATQLVNVDTWGAIEYDWPDGIVDFVQRVETQWYIYWMQSIPGPQNVIPYGSRYITNWWLPIVNWDFAITNSYGLHASLPSSVPEDLGVGRGVFDDVFKFGSLSPNPTNSGSKLEFTLTEDFPLKVSIYDVAGRLVVHLGERSYSVGRHVLAWDGCDKMGRGVSSGVYFYHLEVGGQSKTKRIILVK